MVRIFTSGLLLTILVSGCALLRKVHQDDVQAWINVPVIELETHPEYSQMNLNKQILSNGDVLYDYVNSGTYTNSVNCTGSGNNVSCSGGDTYSITCHHQFFVRDNVIKEYRPLGRCYTDCSRRPASNSCK